jgi:hypothetical protein
MQGRVNEMGAVDNVTYGAEGHKSTPSQHVYEREAEVDSLSEVLAPRK